MATLSEGTSVAAQRRPLPGTRGKPVRRYRLRNFRSRLRTGGRLDQNIRNFGHACGARAACTICVRWACPVFAAVVAKSDAEASPTPNSGIDLCMKSASEWPPTGQRHAALDSYRVSSRHFVRPHLERPQRVHAEGCGGADGRGSSRRARVDRVRFERDRTSVVVQGCCEEFEAAEVAE
jgi:hypothetical protein